MRFIRTCITLQILIVGCFGVTNAKDSQTSNFLDSPREHKAIKAGLVDTLTQVSQGYEIPIIAELSGLNSIEISVPQGMDTGRHVLDMIVCQAPNYHWNQRGQVVHFYEIDLEKASGNFLNINFQ